MFFLNNFQLVYRLLLGSFILYQTTQIKAAQKEKKSSHNFYFQSLDDAKAMLSRFPV